MPRSITVIAILIILADMTLSPLARADGIFTVTPRITVEEQYDDNIDLVPDNEQSDWITLVEPGLSLQYQTPRTTLDLDYDGGLAFYLKDSSRDRTRHRGRFDLLEQLSPHYRLRLDDTFSHSEDPIVIKQGVIVDVAQERNTQIRNTVRALAGWYEGGTYGYEDQLELSYTNHYLHSDSTLTADSLIHEVYLDYDNYWIPAKFATLTTFIFNRSTFNNPGGFAPTNFHQYRAEIVANWRRRPESKDDRTYLKYNFLFQDFDVGNDYMVHQAAIGYGKKFDPLALLYAEVGYYLQDLENSPNNSGFSFNVNFDMQRARFTLGVGGSGGFTMDYGTSQNLGGSKYASSYANLNYQLTPTFSTFVNGNYYWQKSLGDNGRPSQTDQTWGGAVGLARNFLPWLTLSLDVAHIQRESNFPNREFDDNRVTLRLTGAYPFGPY